MKKTPIVLLAPVLGSLVLGACTSTTSSPVVACGPDNVATTNWDVTATINYEAAWYYASVDPISLSYYTVSVATTSDAQRFASGPVTTAVHVSFWPGVSLERKCSHLTFSFLLDHGTSTVLWLV